MTDYPDLSRAKILAFDIETYDPNLVELGPGVYREDGKILGVSLSDGKGFAEYYNIGHYDCSSDERDRNLGYLRAMLGSDVPKVGQSIQYDMDWLENGEHGIMVHGKLASVEIAEALLDESQGHYNLDFMGKKYLGRGKQKSSIDRFCEENGLKGDPRRWLWKMPHTVVREYAVEDANLPIEVYRIQRPMLNAQEMGDLFELECELVRCLLLMRKTGVRIDEDKRDRNGLMIQNRIEEMEQELFAKYGEFNCNSSKQVAAVYDQVGIKYGTTESGNPNIDNYFYTQHKNEIPLVKQMFDLRQCKSHLDKFIMGSHVKFVTPDGRIHCQFHNMRNDSFGALKGTRSGRFSSTNPNLQQQPAKGVDLYWGQMCREDFLPDEDCWWGKIDYSQIEYRFMAHFARGPGSDELRAAYNNDADQDYHQFIMDLTGLKRRYAKNLNFGVAFGMGITQMAKLFGWTLEYAASIVDIYHARAPYIKTTIQDVEKAARRRGYIKTFLKRRSHLVDPSKAYTMYCRLVQGSAADLLKKAMHDCYIVGIFDILPPHVTVHDELGVSVPKTRAGIDAFREMQRIMETCLTLKVPIKAEAEVGPNWADIKEFEWKDLEKEVT